jgi:hypothetical protein
LRKSTDGTKQRRGNGNSPLGSFGSQDKWSESLENVVRSNNIGIHVVEQIRGRDVVDGSKAQHDTGVNVDLVQCLGRFGDLSCGSLAGEL